MNPVRIFLQLLSSPSAGTRFVGMALLVLLAIAVVVGVVYGYHYVERKQRRRARRRRHRTSSAPPRKELTQEDVEGDVW